MVLQNGWRLCAPLTIAASRDTSRARVTRALQVVGPANIATYRFWMIKTRARTI